MDKIKSFCKKCFKLTHEGEEEQHCDWCKDKKFDMPEGFEDLFKGFTK